jgi:hypothetical protein
MRGAIDGAQNVGRAAREIDVRTNAHGGGVCPDRSGRTAAEGPRSLVYGIPAGQRSSSFDPTELR